jgi:hypothetical protein
MGNSNSSPDNNSVGSQAKSSILLLLITSAVIVFIQYLYYIFTSKSLNFISILDETVSADAGMKVISQNPNIAESIQIGLSVNERTGIEFAYSFYLYINPSTFSGEYVLKSIFHKGYTKLWPLMGPGVFMLGNTNTMRVIMNTQTSPYTYIDITNIPVQKWVHVVLNCYKSGLDIYINGNLATRLSLKGTMPYQNFQDIIIFSQSIRSYNKSTINSLTEDVRFNGAISGQISAFKYARYALSINEINALMTQGPSKKVKVNTTESPPYNGDTWWVDQQTM